MVDAVKPKILVAREIFPEVIARLEQHFDVDANQSDVILGVEGLKARLAGKAGVMTAVTDPVTAEVIAAAPGLKAVCNFAVGFNNVDVAACTRAGVMVTNTPGVLDDTTADMAWALLMASARRVPQSERWLRDGQWHGWQFIQWLGTDVHHATLGILGMGRIGQAVARRALGFDMKVIYHKRTPLPAATEAESKARWVDKETLLRESDFLVLLLPYNADSHHIIGAAELALMKPTAHLINIARGGIVDDEALIAALRQRRLSGAALDVFEGEPKFNPAFLELDNVVLTPHIGSSSRATRMAMAMTAADNLIEALAGRRPPNLLNPDVMQ
jgi:lactate dehydrogenase-like 2-hydroxyacid dehydrogenase